MGLNSVLEHQQQVHRGLFVSVDFDSGITVCLVDLKNGTDIKQTDQPLLVDEKAKQKLLEVLIEAELLHKEAQALMDCWDPHFFQEPGQRLIYLLDRKEYDYVCPLKFRPEPTEIARVGLVITEFVD